MLLMGIVVLAALAFVGTRSTSEASDDDGLRTYRVTIENETAGQPFSPGVAITHKRPTGLLHVGDHAPAAIEANAEDGNDGPAVAAEMAAQAKPDVFELD